MKKSHKKIINKKSIAVVLMTSIVMTGMMLSSALRIARADINTLDSIQNQIETLDGLNYSSKNIKKIIKMTNKDMSFYMENYSDKIVIGRYNGTDQPEDIRIIDLITTQN